MKKIKVTKQSFLLKWKGLLGVKKPYSLLLQTRFGIHTFGLTFPIDVVILDRSFVVRKFKERLSPNKIFLWNPHYDYVLELPTGSIQKYGLVIGEKIVLEYF